MRGPVIFHHAGMVDRNVGSTLIEIGYGIATVFIKEDTRSSASVTAPWGIDKTRLYGLPPFRKTFAFRRIKIANVELFNPLLAIR